MSGFVACTACTGSRLPVLCASCAHNRDLISRLERCVRGLMDSAHPPGSESTHEEWSAAWEATARERHETLKRVETFLHERRMHPDYEYAATVIGIGHSEQPPDGDGWERNGGAAHGHVVLAAVAGAADSTRDFTQVFWRRLRSR